MKERITMYRFQGNVKNVISLCLFAYNAQIVLNVFNATFY